MKKTLILLAIVMLSGCASTKKEIKDITIEHKLGATQVSTNPEKVVVYDMGILDIMTYLDLPVGGVAQDSLPEALNQYKDASILNAGTLFEANFELLAEYAPDLIIISGRASEQYEELSKIAPTIYMGSDSDETGLVPSIKTNIETFSKIYPNHDFSEAMPKLEAKVKELHDLAQASEWKTMFVMANGNEIKAFGPKSRYAHVYEDFGFEATDYSLDPSTHGASISFELLNSLQADVIIVMDRAAVTGGTVFAKELMDNDFVKGTPAYKNQRIVYVNPQTWYITEGGYSAVLSMCEELQVLFK